MYIEPFTHYVCMSSSLVVIILKNSLLQVVIGLVLSYQRRLGIRSAGINFLFWLGLLLYGSIKVRSIVLISKDNVRGG